MKRKDESSLPPTPRRAPLDEALARIGRDANARRLILDAIKTWERQNERLGESLRDSTTGYIVDALHADEDSVTRQVASHADGSGTDGRELSFTMLYRSKIGREFAMADEPMEHAWEPQTTELLRRMAAQAKFALIGGAYSGDHAIPMMAEMAVRGGICFCFEPNLEQAEMLRTNALANDLENYSLSNDGLWGETTTLVMIGFDSHAHPEVYSGQEGDVFEAVAIDDYCHEHSVETLDIIMLDNMVLDKMLQCIALINGKAKTEISGGVTYERLEEISTTGADFVSVGALTHSAPAVDISMCITPE